MNIALLPTFAEQEQVILDYVNTFKYNCKDTEHKIKDLVYTLDDVEHPYSLFVPTEIPSENPCLVEMMPQRIVLTPYAETQLLQRLSIPAAYFHRCPGSLRAANINHWINVYGNKTIMLRWNGQRVRAILSTRFSPELDDQILMPLVFQSFREATGHRVRKFQKGDDITILRTVFTSAHTEHNGKHMWAGVTVVNSEVGRSSIWIKPMVIYGNSEDEHQYSFMDRNLEGCESIRHTSELTIDRVRDAITRARDVAQVGIYRLLEAEKELVNPIASVKELVEDCDFLTNRLVEVIEEEYKDIAFVSKLKLAQSMLEAVKALPLFKRYLAECEIGRYLDLFADTEERLNSIVQAAQLVEQQEVVE